MSLADKTLREMGEAVTKLSKGEGVLNANKAINVLDNFFGVPQAAYKMMQGDGFKKAVETTFKHDNGKGGLNVAKIAGSYIGVSAAGRVLSGGGVYKDNRGQSNLIGVPFV